MTLKESVLQEIETVDDKLLEEILQLIRSRDFALGWRGSGIRDDGGDVEGVQSVEL